MKEQQARYDARAIHHGGSRKIGFLPLCAMVLMGLAGSASGQNPPPPPRFLSQPPGGTGACPYTVFLTDDQPNASIAYTTSGNAIPYNPATGIKVTDGATITATAYTVDPNTQSAPTVGQYFCAAFTSFDLTLATGNDDARTDSLITAQATFNDGKALPAWCLKQSDQGMDDTCPRTTAPDTWKPGTSRTFSLPVSGNTSMFFQLSITQSTWPTGVGQKSDNWDLYSLSLTGHANASPGYPDSVQLLNEQPFGAPCYARFMHPTGESQFGKPTTIWFLLDTTKTPMVPDTDGSHPAPYCPEDHSP